MPIIALRSDKVRQSTSQCRQPRGWLGRLSVWSMNRRHSALTDWGLEAVSIGTGDTILDVGCGGGRTVAKLAARATAGHLHGVDFAPASIAVSRRTNRRSIALGRVSIEQASVSALPFAAGTFDLATAIETHFWWQSLGDGMREVVRVLKPGGTLVVIAEFYNGGRHTRYAERLGHLTGMAALDVAQHQAMLSDAGLTNIRVIEDARRGWLCAIGTKPS
ncbi:MAG TPA: class I SAM-dependent methyltransferase [Gemmatimonadaceae bacterium]|nr:class I SAM-dependent methyltransferase [Gemmatimonadaceae bacterium]